jgi:hypothetical protein
MSGAPTHQNGAAAYLGLPTLTRTGARLITKDDHLRRVEKAELRGLGPRAFITALTTGPLNIWASLGTGHALVAGGVAGAVQLLGEAAALADGRKRVVDEGFAQMEANEVEEWLNRDTGNLTLAVQAVIQATAAFDEQKIAALGRAFRAGVTDDARVDESLLVVLALGAVERPHIKVLHVIAREQPPSWSKQHDHSNKSRAALHFPMYGHYRPDKAATAVAGGDASPGTHTAYKRRHTAYGGLRWAI